MQMERPIFNKSDVVRLRSGGPNMVVVNEIEWCGQISVMWIIEGENSIARARLPACALELAHDKRNGARHRVEVLWLNPQASHSRKDGSPRAYCYDAGRRDSCI